MGKGVFRFALSSLLHLPNYVYLAWVFFALFFLAGAGDLLRSDSLGSSSFSVLGQLFIQLLVALLFLVLYLPFMFGALTRNAFVKLGWEPPPFGFVKALKLILLVIASYLAALFSAFNLKWLGLAVVLVVLGLVTATVPALAFLSTILLGVSNFYFLIVFYNQVRLMLASTAFVAGEEGMFASLKSTWGLTRGRFWSLFLHVLGIYVLSVLIGLVVSVVLNLIVSGPMLSTVVAASVSGDFGQLLAALGSILFFFFAWLWVVVSLNMMLFSWGFAKLYANLSGEEQPFVGTGVASTAAVSSGSAPAWQAYKPSGGAPGARPSKYASLADLAKDKDLDDEEPEDLDQLASPSTAAKHKAKPKGKDKVAEAGEEDEPTDVEELDFSGLGGDEEDEDKK